MDAEMASWKSTGTYIYAVLPPEANIVDGMWIFRVKRPPGSPPVFKALEPPVANLRSLSGAPRVARHTQENIEALGFAPSTAYPSLFLLTDPSLSPFYFLMYVVQHFRCQFSLPQSTPLPTSNPLSGPSSDESVEPSGPHSELVGCLMCLMT
ncbi:unnamed protein product [Closterium sp. NIES-53]